jgi:hypothetical protein
MIASIQIWATRTIWLMTAVFIIWASYVIALHYGSCRANGTNQLICLAFALFLGGVEILYSVLLTIARLLLWILP